jgi:hypothetical protein
MRKCQDSENVVLFRMVDFGQEMINWSNIGWYSAKRQYNGFVRDWYKLLVNDQLIMTHFVSQI